MSVVIFWYQDDPCGASKLVLMIVLVDLYHPTYCQVHETCLILLQDYFMKCTEFSWTHITPDISLCWKDNCCFCKKMAKVSINKYQILVYNNFQLSYGLYLSVYVCHWICSYLMVILMFELNDWWWCYVRQKSCQIFVCYSWMKVPSKAFTRQRCMVFISLSMMSSSCSGTDYTLACSCRLK